MTVLVVDSGLGGLSVVKALRSVAPRAAVDYWADDAAFPYGELPAAKLIDRVVDIVSRAASERPPKVVIIACNTASTVVLQSLRERFSFPVVGIVPGIRPAAGATRSGMFSVLATPATARGAYASDLIARFAAGLEVTLVGARRLATLTERALAGHIVTDAELLDEIAPCFVRDGDRRTDVVVLGCTHYPLILERLAAVAPWPVQWIDPAPAVIRHMQSICPSLDESRGDRLHFTSGRVHDAAVEAIVNGGGLRLAREPARSV